MLEYIKCQYDIVKFKLHTKYMFHSYTTKVDIQLYKVINNLEWYYESVLVYNDQRLEIVDNIMDLQEDLIDRKTSLLNISRIERINIGYKHILNYKHINSEIESNYCYKFIIAVFEEILKEFRNENYLVENDIDKLIIKLRHKFRKEEKYIWA
jgi:hypothetical protein